MCRVCERPQRVRELKAAFDAGRRYELDRLDSIANNPAPDFEDWVTTGGVWRADH